MLYDDRFSGHLSELDYRGPLHAAGGCIWPTIPAMRYYLWSNNATGIFLPLRTTGILVQQTTQDPNHDRMNWAPVYSPPLINCDLFRKTIWENRLGYTWDIEINAGSPCGGVLVWKIEIAEQKCNVSVPIGNQPCVSQPTWTTGDDFHADQVEFDEIEPPDY